MNGDFKSTPRTDMLLSNQQFDNVDYDTSCQQLTELCRELERVLRRCIAEMKYSAEIGQPISLDRVEFEMAKKVLGEE